MSQSHLQLDRTTSDASPPPVKWMSQITNASKVRLVLFFPFIAQRPEGGNFSNDRIQERQPRIVRRSLERQETPIDQYCRTMPSNIVDKQEIPLIMDRWEKSRNSATISVWIHGRDIQATGRSPYRVHNGLHTKSNGTVFLLLHFELYCTLN